MKAALLAIDAILFTAEEELARPIPDVIEARAGLEAARERLLAIVEDQEVAARN